MSGLSLASSSAPPLLTQARSPDRLQVVTLSCQGRPALVVALLPHSVPSQLVPPLFCFAAGQSATLQTTRAATALLEYNFKPSSL